MSINQHRNIRYAIKEIAEKSSHLLRKSWLKKPRKRLTARRVFCNSCIRKPFSNWV
jgi:hypothetical protein